MAQNHRDSIFGQSRIVAARTVLLALLILLAASSQASPAQQVIRAQRGLVQLGGPFNANAGVSLADEEAGPIEGGGVVKTDPDLESIMEKADRYQEDGNYRVATQLWQAVLERSGDALFSSDEKTYYSMIARVEQVIAKLPPEGLKTYRVNADAKAKEILTAAGNPNDIAALSTIVRMYFLSSEGDDAAFRLGSIYLDEYDFVGARRVFMKIIQTYPDPSVSMADVHARLALCETALGNLGLAIAALDSAEKIDGSLRNVSAVRAVVEDAEKGVSLGTTNRPLDETGAWTMPLGNAKRYGVGPSVPDDMMAEDLVAVWQYAFEPKDRFIKAADTIGKVMVGSEAHSEKVNSSRVTPRETALMKRWRSKTWRPTGQLLFVNDQVVFKSGADLTSWRQSQIEAMISGTTTLTPEIKNFVQWRSVQRNSFDVDPATVMEQAIQKNIGEFRGFRGNTVPDTATPYAAADIQLFGDEVHAQMSVVNGLVYSIEGIKFDDKFSKNRKTVSSMWNQTYRRVRENSLVAYDAESGMVKWRLPQTNDEELGDDVEPDWIDEGGFMGAPIAFENTIIVPVNRGGSIWLYSLDPAQQGKTIWRAYLCDEPETGTPAWPSIQISINGSDVFVNCGLGLTFIVDPATGMVRLAKRYERIGVLDPAYRRSNWSVKRALFDGWRNNLVVPYGSQAISFCADTNLIQSIDRNTGELMWNCEVSPISYKVDYLLGIHNDVLYAAGKETIVAFDLKGDGRMMWGAEQLFGDRYSLGRGWLTSKGIYMPVQDKIMLFSLDGKKDGSADLLKTVHVDLGGAPVGNLYGDGRRFWVHNGNRLFVLGTKAEAKRLDANLEKRRKANEATEGTKVQ